MKTSKLACMLLLALLLQTTFAEILSVSGPTHTEQFVADFLISAAPENLQPEGPKDSNAINAAQRIIDGFKDLERSICQPKSDSSCKPEVPTLGIKGSPQIAEQLKEYWETRRGNTQNGIEAQEEERFSASEAYDDLIGSRNLRGDVEDPQSNLRKLFSANNQYPEIDQGNFLAWQDNYLFVVTPKSQLMIIDTNGRPWYTTFTANIHPSLKMQQVIVHGDFFIFISNNTVSSFPETVINVGKYSKTEKTLTYIREFRRAGTVVQAREINGYLHIVTQGDQIADLSWSVYGYSNGLTNLDIVKVEGVNLNYCPSQNKGMWVRNIATIQLSFNPTYTFDAYIGCNKIRKAMLAPSGNWYILSTDNFIQKVHKTQSNTPKWVKISNITLHVQTDTDWNEYGNCTLQIAGSQKGVANWLNLFSLDCKSFDSPSTTKFEGPAKDSIQTVKWIGRNAYMSFWKKGQIWQFQQQNSTNVAYKKKMLTKLSVRLMYKYGPNHMIAVAFPTIPIPNITIALIDLTSLTTLIQYTIVPSTFFRLIQVDLLDPRLADADIDVDFANKRIVFPMLSGDKEPYANGFFYLHIEVGPTPCMITPPIDFCNVTGTAPIQSVTLPSNVYKHWKQVGQPWQTTPSQHILRSVTLPSKEGIQTLYTLSKCQLQVRDDPISTGSLSYRPSRHIHLCT